MITNAEQNPDELKAFLTRMARIYFPANALADTESPERITARVMSAGTYRDVCELVDLAGRAYLVHVFTSVPFHWFSQPAREYWQRHLEVGPMPQQRVLRDFKVARGAIDRPLADAASVIHAAELH
jgi:hypothetical protein